MKKFLVFVLVVFGMVSFIGCDKAEEPIFKVGSDEGAYQPAELSGWEVHKQFMYKLWVQTMMRFSMVK